jgi:hypothetical protein
MKNIKKDIQQGSTHSRHQNAFFTKFRKLARNICGVFKITVLPSRYSLGPYKFEAAPTVLDP